MIKHKRILTWSLTAVCLSLLATTCIAWPSFANDAGIGTEVHDGECRWWGTCSTHGLAWVSYVLKVNPLNKGLHLHYTDNTGGPVNFGDCAPDNSMMRLYNYGFIAFNDANSSTDPHTSYNQQVATIKRGQSGAKYLNENFSGVYPDSDRGAVYNRSSSNKATFNSTHYEIDMTEYVKEGTYNPKEKGTCYSRYADGKNGGYKTVAYAFCLMAEADKNNGDDKYLHGISWDDVGWFCYDSSITNLSKSEINVGNGLATAKAFHASQSRVTATVGGGTPVTVKKGEPIVLDFVHSAWATNVDNKPQTTWFYEYTIDGVPQTGKNNQASKSIYLDTKAEKAIEGYNPAYIAKNALDKKTGALFHNQRSVTLNDVNVEHTYCERQYRKDDSGAEKNFTEVCVILKGEEREIGEYYSFSKVEANGQPLTTEIYHGIADTETLKIDINVGDTVTGIKFTHRGLSDLKITEDVTWTKKYGKKNDPIFCPDNNCAGTHTGPMKTKKTYSMGTLYTTGSKATFETSYGDITFNATGSYRLCEAILSPDNSTKTTVCLKIKVGDGPDDDDDDDPPGDNDNPPGSNPPTTTCEDHAPSSYGLSDFKSGTTSTWSMVETKTGQYRYAENGGSIWAKPDDKIYFEHCYFPGAQAVRTNDSAVTHRTTLTDTDWASLPKYSTNWNDSPKLTSKTFNGSDYKVGELVRVVAQANNFTVDTNNYSLLKNGSVTFSVTGGGFSLRRSDNHSTTWDGELGNTSDAKTTTNDLTILPAAAGQVISQNIVGAPGTASIGKVDDRHSGTWNYVYPVVETSGPYATEQSEDPEGCPSAPKYNSTSIELATGVTVTYSGDDAVSGCEKKIDVEAKACGEDDGENCEPVAEESHYIWYEKHPGVRTSSQTWYLYHTNDAPGDFKNYWTSFSSSGSASSEVYVNVPYNYNNSINVEFADGNIYSGETFGVKEARVTVDTRRNDATDGDYATIVPNSVAKLYVFHSATDLSSRGGSIRTGEGDCGYYSGIGGLECSIAETGSKALNTGMNTSGSNSDTFFNGQSYNVYDLKAGEYMCIGVSIWPSAPDGDKDMLSTTGNNTASYSAPVCKPVYKRPTFQIWNGGLYAAGKVEANSFTKNVLSGYVGYQTSGSVQQHTFSSWIEQGIVVNKGISGLASGAATGFTTNDDGKLTNNPGGIGGTNFCTVSTLTIPNTSCNRLANINFVSAGLQRAKNTIYDTIYNAIINGRTYKAVSGSVNLSDANNYSETTPGMRYTESSDSSQLTISSSSPLTRNLSHVIHAKGKLTISSNLSYDNSISYTTSSQVPQYMIFADGDIDISCGVSRIDAWLVSKGTINTCADGGDENNAARSNQLIVRGVVIADKLELTRTYGASIGNTSGVPAEIFILSATNRFFGKTSSSEDPTLYTVYLRELSPRY